MILDDRIFIPPQVPRVDPARLVLLTPPAEVWSASDADVQSWLKLDSDADAALVNRLLIAARRYVERVTGLCLCNQQWRADFDRLPDALGFPGVGWLGGRGRELVIPRAPLVSIDSVKYKAVTTGTLTTFSAANYSAGTAGNATALARLWLNSDASWPDLGDFPAALQVTFTAGFGATAASVPEDLTLAILMLAAHWYEKRGTSDGEVFTSYPQGFDSLLEMHRLAFIA